MSIEDPAAPAAVREILSVAAVHQPENLALALVADGAVIWECEKEDQPPERLASPTYGK